MLRGARLVSATETEEGRAWAESRIKQLTGGDPISARFMRQDFFTYVPTFKLVFIGNHKPALRNVDDAARRRFNIVPFLHKPPTPDQHLEQKLRAEWPAILRWMIDGCLAWQRDGLVRPAIVAAATEEYFSEQDILRQWVEECCEIGRRNLSDTQPTCSEAGPPTRSPAAKNPEPKNGSRSRSSGSGFGQRATCAAEASMAFASRLPPPIRNPKQTERGHSGSEP